jgi:hypothetical protein
LAAADARELEKALARNIFVGMDSTSGPRRLARYARAVFRQVADLDADALHRGEVVYPSPESIVDE